MAECDQECKRHGPGTAQSEMHPTDALRIASKQQQAAGREKKNMEAKEDQKEAV